MSQYLYFSLTPEALVASMLEPEAFGSYYAVGSDRKTQGQALFFEIDPAFRAPYFDLDSAFARCVPKRDGSPKRSVYVSTYRVLEHIPLRALLRLHLVTKDGRTLPIEPAASLPALSPGLHLYQELAPVRTLAASPLGPEGFFKLLVGGSGESVFFPAICFAELRLGELAKDPERGSVGNLPYDNIDHLRNCLTEVRGKNVASKLVDRSPASGIPFRVLEGGVWVGNTKDGLAFFALPTNEQLLDKHYAWWRSASM
jgi:hypothetical protein